MTVVLVRKLLRDVWLPLVVMGLLLAGFQGVWAKMSERVVGHLIPALNEGMPLGIRYVKKVLFDGPGKIMQTLMGGETINFERPLDMLSIGYVHPLLQTILCVWAISRASGAVAGELDRGTMELLMAQPISRPQVILAHLAVDVITIPVLCLSLWAGNWIGLWLSGLLRVGPPGGEADLAVDPTVLWPCLVSVGALLFAVSGLTVWMSACGRYRNRVFGLAFLTFLVMFVINLVGQLWDAVGPLRPLTVFYYFQPQQMLLSHRWTMELGAVWNHGRPLLAVNGVLVLGLTGLTGYALALWVFCRRELPAPL